ncbi:Uncharacterized protein Rs2_48746 [Raphanus sativus]|uniref:Uncharacterized protein LOC108821190 n=1 Tax=Raphanus sativus TaxID=3726 RepID=A0A6J0KRQ8_RAPSA|nr:uncharacterized protein LOC108821190 [Raphanus sativus]KAJ4869683.1 Uncharacterized protein Rs2_48746 [Raphanus sativus]
MVSKGWDPGIGDMGFRGGEANLAVDIEMIKGYNGTWGKEIGRLYGKVVVAKAGLFWPLSNMGKSTQNKGYLSAKECALAPRAFLVWYLMGFWWKMDEGFVAGWRCV